MLDIVTKLSYFLVLEWTKFSFTKLNVNLCMFLQNIPNFHVIKVSLYIRFEYLGIVSTNSTALLLTELHLWL